MQRRGPNSSRQVRVAEAHGQPTCLRIARLRELYTP
jgi:hypothetical protein